MKILNNVHDILQYTKEHIDEIANLQIKNTVGAILKESFYKNGKLHGVHRKYENNILVKLIIYKLGVKHGEYHLYNTRGSSIINCFYKNGKQHGEYKTFHKNGTINEHCFLIDDVEQPQLQYLTTERDEITLTLLFGKNYIK